MSLRARDGGAAALTTVMMAALATAMLVVVLAVAGRIALRAHIIDAVADRAALAVLSGSTLAGGPGAPAVAAGQRVVRDAAATLRTIDVAGWPASVVVTVTGDLGVPLVGGQHTAIAAATMQP